MAKVAGLKDVGDWCDGVVFMLGCAGYCLYGEIILCV